MVMALTQVEPYVVDSTASFTVGNLSTGNVTATGTISTTGNVAAASQTLTGNLTVTNITVANSLTVVSAITASSITVANTVIDGTFASNTVNKSRALFMGLMFGG
jgi:hypothetical protein